MAALLLLSILLQFCLGHSNGYAIEPKIVNGIESHPEEFPFFVNIIHPRMVCGAALISDRLVRKLTCDWWPFAASIATHGFLSRWIVTAGHCLRKRLNFHVDIGVGAKGRFQRSIRIDTDHQHLYPGHNETMKLFDIGNCANLAYLLIRSLSWPWKNDDSKIKLTKKLNIPGLIELPEPIELSPSIQPVPLPRTCDQVAQYELVYAAGNGRTNYKKPATDRTLRYGVSEVMPNDECAAKIKDHEDPNAIIYAYSIDGRDVGSGDSGRSWKWNKTISCTHTIFFPYFFYWELKQRIFSHQVDQFSGRKIKR